MNAGCISVLHLITPLCTSVEGLGTWQAEAPISVLPSHGAWFSPSSNGATEITSESSWGTVDCQVAPTETAVYGFISHTFLCLPSTDAIEVRTFGVPDSLAAAFC